MATTRRITKAGTLGPTASAETPPEAGIQSLSSTHLQGFLTKLATLMNPFMPFATMGGIPGSSLNFPAKLPLPVYRWEQLLRNI